MKLENVLIPQCVRGFPSALDLFDVELRDGVVAHISPTQHAIDSGANSIPGGTLAGKPLGTLLPALVDMHVHIDKGGTL